MAPALAARRICVAAAPCPGAPHLCLCPAFHAAIWRREGQGGGKVAGAGERADASMAPAAPPGKPRCWCLKVSCGSASCTLSVL